MNYILIFIYFLVSLSFMNTLCAKEVDFKIYDNTMLVLKYLKNKRILFAHQSVGQDIINGIQTINAKSSDIKLNIKETRDENDFNGPIFAHTRVGKNHDPKSKIDDFKRLITFEIKGKVNIAFVKLCFVDINKRTDNVEDIFKYYVKTLNQLKAKFPNITFIHFTVPLTRLQRGPRAWLKKIIGKPVGGYLENIKRQEYNQLIRHYYSGKEPVFDIALLESTREDGTQESYQASSGTYPALVPSYTNDGGHLNEKSREMVAQQLLQFLAKVQ